MMMFQGVGFFVCLLQHASVKCFDIAAGLGMDDYRSTPEAAVPPEEDAVSI